MQGLTLIKNLWTASAEGRLVLKDLHDTGGQYQTSVHIVAGPAGAGASTMCSSVRGPLLCPPQVLEVP